MHGRFAPSPTSARSRPCGWTASSPRCGSTRSGGSCSRTSCSTRSTRSGRLSARHPARAEALTAHLGDLLRTLLAGVGRKRSRWTGSWRSWSPTSRSSAPRAPRMTRLEVRPRSAAARAMVPVRLLQPMAAMATGTQSAAIAVLGELRGGELRVELASPGAPAEDAAEQARALAGGSSGSTVPPPARAGGHAAGTRVIHARALAAGPHRRPAPPNGSASHEPAAECPPGGR